MCGDIAFVCCDNGLGHLKRIYLFALALADEGFVSDIFSPLHKFLKIAKLFGENSLVRNRDFATGSNRSVQTGNFANWQAWTHRIGSLEEYPIIISDNLLEILDVRPDAVLSANFFWNETLGFPQEDTENYRRIMTMNSTVVIGSELFSPISIRNLPGFRGIGLLDTFSPARIEQEKNAVLFSAGHSGLELGFFNQRMQQLANHPMLRRFHKISDPQLMLNGINETGKFDSLMYQRLRYAFIRPGMGTLNDLLVHGVIPVCLTDGSNQELLFNARRVEELGLGLHLQSNDDIDDFMLRMESTTTSCLEKISDINKAGISQFTSIVKSLYE